jgi:hypothetical protein
MRYMNRFLFAIFIVFMISTLSCQAQALEKSNLLVCEAQLTAKFTIWRFAPVTPDVAAFAKDRHEDPTVTYGDFDGDGRRDVALLIQNGDKPEPDYPRRLDSLHIAVCLNTKAGVKLYLIDKPYCGDGITCAPKGQPYYDYDTGKKGTYRLDGVSAYCFEQAGATYEFENGIFRQIVDSD